MPKTTLQRRPAREGAGLFLLAVLVLVASAGAGTPDLSRSPDRNLVGTCVDESSAPCAGVIHAFFDVAGASASESGVERVDVATEKDGTYRVPVPEGATSATLRAEVGSTVHFGATVWLLGSRRTKESIDVDPIRCGKLTSAELEIRMDDGEPVEEGAVYYFTEKEFPGETAPLLGSARESRLVARIHGAENVTAPGIPASGGYLRIDGVDCASVVQALRRKGAGGVFAESVTLSYAPTLSGLAPGAQLYGDDFRGRKVQLAAFSDPVASNGPTSRAIAIYLPTSTLAEFEVAAGQLFYLGGLVGYAPVLGAWIEGADPSTLPDLISASDPVTGRYDTWVTPARSVFEIEIPKARGKAGQRLAKAALFASLTVSSTMGSYGDSAEISRDKKNPNLLELVPERGRSAGGDARLELRADAAKLFDEVVRYAPGRTTLELDALPELSVVRLTLRDRVTSKPIAGGLVEAYVVADDFSYPSYRFTTDDSGEASALFLAGEDVRFIADGKQFSQAEPLVVTTEKGETRVEVAVGQGVGTLKVTVGSIDDAPCRVALMRVGPPVYSFVRAGFPIKGDDVESWSVEATDQEVRAAAVRPGGTFEFQGVPEGEYVLTVQTDLEIDGGDVYAAHIAAYGGPMARRIVIKAGDALEATIDAPAKKPVSVPVAVCKQLAKDLKNARRTGLQPTASAVVAIRSDDLIDWDRESSFDIALAVEEGPVVAGELIEGWPYLVRISGLGPVDSMHLVRPGAGVPVRLDGAFEFELKGKSKDAAQVEIVSEPRLEDGRAVNTAPLTRVLTIKPKRNRIRLDGLSPWARHTVTITRGNASRTLELEPLGSDRLAKPERKTRALLRKMQVTLRVGG